MPENETPKMEIETLSDDDLESVSGGMAEEMITQKGGACTGAGGTCTAAGGSC